LLPLRDGPGSVAFRCYCRSLFALWSEGRRGNFQWWGQVRRIADVSVKFLRSRRGAEDCSGREENLPQMNTDGQMDADEGSLLGTESLLLIAAGEKKEKETQNFAQLLVEQFSARVENPCHEGWFK